jgi:uncharacterized protein DUF551
MLDTTDLPLWCTTTRSNILRVWAAQEYPAVEVPLLGRRSVCWFELIAAAEERERKEATGMDAITEGVADAIDAQLGGRATIHAVGGPTESLQRALYDARLVLAAEAAVAAARPVLAWRPIGPAPLAGQTVLVCAAGRPESVGVGFWNGTKWHVMNGRTWQQATDGRPVITHWMPLPEVAAIAVVLEARHSAMPYP